MVRTGSIDVFKRLSEITFGIHAQTAALASGFRIRLDEWHAWGSKTVLDSGYFAEGSIGYRGRPFSSALLADPFLTAGFENTGAAFENSEAGFSSAGQRKGSFSLAFDSQFFGFLNARMKYGQTSEAAGVPAAGAPDPEGAAGSSYTHSLSWDLGSPFIPALSHTFHKTQDSVDEIRLAEGDYLESLLESNGESVSFEERLGSEEGLVQTYSFSRHWSREAVEVTSGSSGQLTDLSHPFHLNQNHEAGLSFRWNHGATELRARREEIFSSPGGAFDPSPFAAYAGRMSTLFQPWKAALPGGSLDNRTDAALFSLSVPRSRYLGLELSLDADFTERNTNPTLGTRDVSFTDSLLLSVPSSPVGTGQIQLIPEISRTFTGTIRGAPDVLDEASLLLTPYSALLKAPFYYLNPFNSTARGRVLDAVDIFQASSADSVNQLQAALALRLITVSEPWFVPSRAKIFLENETIRDGTRYTQGQSLGFSIGKQTRFSGTTDTLSLDFSYQQDTEYATRVLANTISADSSLLLSHRIPGKLEVRHSISYERRRQRAGDWRLYLFPEDPSFDAPVPERPDTDTVTSELEIEYLWESRAKAGGPSSQAPTPLISHSDRLTVENSYTFSSQREGGNKPLRITYEHSSAMERRENTELTIDFRALGGWEEAAAGAAAADAAAADAAILPFFGFEFGVSLRLRL
jgi:hypothetical protein